MAHTFGYGPPAAIHERAPTADVAVQHTSWRICKPRLHFSALLRRLFSKEARRSRESTTGAGRTDKGVHGAFGLAPDLWARSLVMCTSVGNIVELVSPNSVGRGLCVSLSLVVVIIGILECYGYLGKRGLILLHMRDSKV